MSFDTFKQFEESLQASRARRRIPNVNKNVLKRVIQSTEAHNRNQEEQEMWMKHFASKKAKEKRQESSDESKDSREPKKRKKKKRKKNKRDQGSPVSKNVDKYHPDYGNDSPITKVDEKRTEIGPSVDEFMVSKNLKWGHDGYHELYSEEKNHNSNSGSNTDRDEAPKKLKKKKKHKKKKSKWVEKSENSSSDSSSERFEKKRRKKDR